MPLDKVLGTLSESKDFGEDYMDLKVVIRVCPNIAKQRKVFSMAFWADL